MTPGGFCRWIVQSEVLMLSINPSICPLVIGEVLVPTQSILSEINPSMCQQLGRFRDFSLAPAFLVCRWRVI